jgi:hypothetical protein
MSTPRPTAIWLGATLVLTASTLAAFLGSGVTAGLALGALTALFATRVVGQLIVAAARPAWLPLMDEWNFVPYRFLLPAQVVLLTLMVRLATLEPGQAPTLGRVLVALAGLYWAAMGARYAIRMARRPAARWLGGTIPIVFHCVLAAFVFVLGVAHIGAEDHLAHAVALSVL